MSQQCFPKESAQQSSSVGESVKDKKADKCDKEQGGKGGFKYQGARNWEATVNEKLVQERSQCK